ncbi:UAA transporter [Flagelloscypha sp. PMI_526]|nr:UAA transporter [Flagelloscypha sp. PMI_526]
MSFIRLIVCVAGVYAMFLVWAIAQERLSVPFDSIDGTPPSKFKSALFLGTCQSILCSIAAFFYIIARRPSGESLSQSLGLTPSSIPQTNGIKSNGNAIHKPLPSSQFSPAPLLLQYLQCSTYITLAAPFGFAALNFISYPAMVLGKSCKLVPVLLMNVLIYRRKFAPYKYGVVSLVTAGITMFMFFGDEASKKGKHGKSTKASDEKPPYAELIGMTYLLINLALDGLVNSTQDEIFSHANKALQGTKPPSGAQMMFWINVFCTFLSCLLGGLPLPYIPVLHPSSGGTTELGSGIAFARTHPSIISPLFQFAVTGALGQIFIFETLSHFGSLTLVTITLTRKLFTMLLSVVLYNHKLNRGQWAGAAVVFSGISLEAWIKRRDVHAKRVLQEKEKAKIKSL